MAPLLPRSSAGETSDFSTTSSGASSTASPVRNRGVRETAAWVRAYSSRCETRLSLTNCASPEAFVVCEGYREQPDTPDLTKPLLDFVDISDYATPTADKRLNRLKGSIRVIAPFVACGDLRCVQFRLFQMKAALTSSSFYSGFDAEMHAPLLPKDSAKDAPPAPAYREFLELRRRVPLSAFPLQGRVVLLTLSIAARRASALAANAPQP